MAKILLIAWHLIAKIFEMNTNPEKENTTVDTPVKPEKSTKKSTKSDKKETLLKEELEAAKASLQEEKDKFLRLYAEFENYKRRTAKERIELFKTAGEEVLSALLPVVDDFDRAVKELSKNSENEPLLQGVKLIHNKLKETLKSKGLEEFEVKSGDDFNADFHEAVTQIPAPEPKLKGKIVDVIEKGYKLTDKIIRYPKVVTGQ